MSNASIQESDTALTTVGSDRRRAESILEAIVESSDDAILSKDLDGTITSWNRAAERIFGYTAAEMIGKSVLLLLPEKLRFEETGILAKLRGGERIDHYETVRVTKSGKELNVSLTISPLKNDDGTIYGASKVIRDVTERRKMERALMQSEKLAATERMAATIAHEINNPLEALVNLIYLAKLSIPANSDALGFLDSAEAELSRVSHIAKQALGFYRENAAPEALSLEVLILEVLRTYKPRLKHANISVEMKIEPVSRVLIKRGEILQVISNLIVNSMHAMAGGGKLCLGLESGERDAIQGVVVTITDTGSGISEEDLPRIFEPFFTTRVTIGTGVGLWVSKRFIEGHGGSIKVTTSTDPVTHGTTMAIFLPSLGECANV